jgi:molybdate transport system substrate-binding protein
VAALKHAGIYHTVADRLVMGENVSQAAQFVASGNAQAGIIALSLALAPNMQASGKYVEIPTNSYPAMEQGVVVMRSTRNRAAAEAFLAFLKTSPARSALQRYGFLPAEKPQ